MTKIDASGDLFKGGCHCGAVRFEAELSDLVALACNCSMCARVGYLHCIIPWARFRLLDGEAMLETYTFGTGVAKHTFCGRCGIKAFYTPRSHPDQVSVNLRCLDLEEGVRQSFEIVPFDGQHWEDQVESIR